MTEHFSTANKITVAVAPAAGVAATTDINGATLDMSDYEGVIAIVSFGAITAGAVTSIKAQRGEASDLADAADIAGSAQTIADSDDEKTFYIDIYRPKERYVRLVVDRGTLNAVVASAIYVQYGSRVRPVAAHGTGVAGERHTDAVEGTA